MIEGLKITIRGSEVVEIARAEAARLTKKAERYEANADLLRDDAMNNSSAESMRGKAKTDRREADELLFIAAHIDVSENYQLLLSDLCKLGVVERGY